MDTSNATPVTLEQKDDLYRDGYVVMKHAVSDDLVKAALTRIKAAKKGENLGGEAAMTNLVNASSITPILNELIGEFDPSIPVPQEVREGAPEVREGAPEEIYKRFIASGPKGDPGRSPDVMGADTR